MKRTVQKNSCLLLCVLLFTVFHAQAQQALQGKVVSPKGEALPYTAILVKNSGKGFISNEDGFFIVTVRNTDTLLFRRIGYKPLSLAASVLAQNHLVQMQEDLQEISEVIIQPNDQYLYKEILACRAALFAQPIHQARAYYLLEGEANGKPTELMECYYNSWYSARKVDRLIFKNGRVALAPVNQQFFISIDFSKAFAMNDLTVIDPRQPVSPLQLSKNLLRKRYKLTLGGYSGQNGEVMHIICTPKNKPDKFYAGELWINTQTHLPMKIVLDMPRTDRHPLQSIIRDEGEISNTGIHFEKVFVTHRGQHLVKNTLLKYHYRYVPLFNATERKEKTLEVNSTTLLHFFDHDELFIPPYFSYDEKLDDYRKIGGLSYNESFWNYNSSLFNSRSLQEKTKYFRNNGSMFNYGNSIRQTNRDEVFFKTNYIQWSGKKRLSVIKGNVVSDTTVEMKFKEQVDSRQFDVKAQIYLDINLVNDSPRWFTATIFDTYHSFYFQRSSPQTNCFINIFFDLYEIARRDLEKQFTRCVSCSVAKLDSLYKVQVKKADTGAENYLLRVNRGLDLEEMAHWNEFVTTELGIDNMMIYGLKQSEKR